MLFFLIFLEIFKDVAELEGVKLASYSVKQVKAGMKSFYFLPSLAGFLHLCSCKLSVDNSCNITREGNEDNNLSDYFDIVGKIGSGASGKVYKVTSKENPHCEYAMKKIVNFMDDNETNEKEITVLREMSENPYFPKFYGNFQVQFKGKQTKVLFMELVKGMTLWEMLKKVSFLLIFQSF